MLVVVKLGSITKSEAMDAEWSMKKAIYVTCSNTISRLVSTFVEGLRRGPLGGFVRSLDDGQSCSVIGHSLGSLCNKTTDTIVMFAIHYILYVLIAHASWVAMMRSTAHPTHSSVP